MEKSPPPPPPPPPPRVGRWCASYIGDDAGDRGVVGTAHEDGAVEVGRDGVVVGAGVGPEIRKGGGAGEVFGEGETPAGSRCHGWS